MIELRRRLSKTSCQSISLPQVILAFIKSLFASRHFSVNACLAPLVSMHGQAVITVEGIGSTKTRLHAVQVI